MALFKEIINKMETEEKQMITQMSKKSKIYHRAGCRYINRINEDALTAFDTECKDPLI